MRPDATLGKYKGLEVARREPVADEAIDAELEQLRERMPGSRPSRRPPRRATSSSWTTSARWRRGRALRRREGRDQMIELGSGRLVPGFEEQLEGAAAGDERTVTVTFPEDYGAEHLAGREATFAVTVKEVRRRSCRSSTTTSRPSRRLRHARRAARGHRRARQGARRAPRRRRVPRGGARRRGRAGDRHGPRRAHRGARPRAAQMLH